MISAILAPWRANVDGLFDLGTHLADQYRLPRIGCLDTIKQRQLIDIVIDQLAFADGSEFAGQVAWLGAYAGQSSSRRFRPASKA